MPWHDVQYLKITCRAGPFGGITCGRVGRGASWPARVAADADSTSATTAIDLTVTTALAPGPEPRRRSSQHLQRLETSGAGADLVLIDPVQVQDAQEHVRRALRVV